MWGVGVLQRDAVTVLICVVTVMVGAGMAVAATAGAVAGVAAGGLIALTLWLLMPRREGAIPRRIVLLLAALTFGELLPASLRFLIQMLALVGAYLEWIAAPRTRRRGSAVVGWCTATLALWAGLALLHPNVPDPFSGALGFRKTVLALSGIVLACAIRRELIGKVERLVVALVAAAVAVSVAGHLWFPVIETLVDRDADQYTAMFGGEARLQGIFAGPFHAATAAVFLIGWAAFRRRERRGLALIVGLVGFAGLYLAMVRTAYIAVGLALLAQVISSPTTRTFLRRLLGFVTLAVTACGLFWLSDPAATGTIASIANYASDRRFLNRLPEYAQGIELFQRSPIYGWGAGSAGDTLGDEFGVGFEHVTPHNLLLKFAVEGGLLGLMCIFGLTLAIMRRLDRRVRQAQLAIVSAVGLLGMGLTGSAIETLPVSYLILLMVGLGVDLKPPSGDRLEDVAVGADRDALRGQVVDHRGEVGRQVHRLR